LVAEQFSKRLGSPAEGEWWGWLQETVGSPVAKNPSIIEPKSGI